MKISLVNIISFAFFTVLVFSGINFAQEDLDKLRQIIANKPSAEKIADLHKFQNDYPQSQYFNRATQELFNTFLAVNNTDSTLYYADKYIQSLPEVNRINAYNGIAYTLAESNIGLDTALVYASRAADMGQGNPRSYKMILDTKAYVLFKKGDFKSALETQQEAIKGNEDDPEYLFHLALYQQASGSTEDALKSSAKATLSGDPGEALTKFKEWSSSVNPDIKNKIVIDIINEYISSSDPANQVLARSNASGFLAQTGVNLKEAENWARQGIKSIDKKTPVESYIAFKKNYAIVLTAQKNYKKALTELEEVRSLVDPWTGDYWLTLGKVYESLGNKDKALDAYILGLTGFINPQIMEAAKTLTSEDEILIRVDKMKEGLTSANAGEYKSKTKSSGKTALVELFTGAECGPCVAADRAFDELSEYYPRNTLVILEYHVHIPGPDPLTNPKSFQRYSWYGGNFGTPTVFFEGTEQLTGGGPKFVTANRFNVYNYAIKKYLDEKPEVNISGSAKLNGDKIDIKVSVKPNGKNKKQGKPVLHIALAEKSVNYTGANGIDKHLYVVRDLIDGTEGTEITLKGGKDISKSVNISEIEKTITDYLTDPTKDPSWRFPAFNGWRLDVDKLNDLDKKNLAIVAWVQDADSKEVLQAAYFDVN